MNLKLRQQKLDQIAAEIARCKTCKKGKVGLPVPGEGSAAAKIVFIGEAPGKTESLTGRPFIGRAGKLLRKLISDAGLDEKKIYITSPVKYLPKYITPKPQDIVHGRKHLLDQLEIIRPKIIVLLGSVAAKTLIPEHKLSLSTEHGTIYNQDDIKYFISYHPAAPLHQPKLMPTLLADFKKLKKFLNS